MSKGIGGNNGPDLGLIASNAMHQQQNRQPHYGPHADGLATAQEVNLGEHPVKIPGSIPTLGAGAAIQIPGGVEGHGALSPTELELSSMEPFQVKTQAMPGLHQVNSMGDVGADKIGPGPQLNAMNDHGFGAVDSLSSAPKH